MDVNQQPSSHMIRIPTARLLFRSAWQPDEPLGVCVRCRRGPQSFFRTRVGVHRGSRDHSRWELWRIQDWSEQL